MEKMRKYHRAYAEIDLTAIRRNVMEAGSRLPETSGILAVIKTDAYGHGAVATAKAIDDLAAGYAVASIEEAVELRENNLKKRILVLGYVSPYDYDLLIKYNIIASVFSYEQAEKLSEAAVEAGKKALCHIKVDTGMNRIGFEAKTTEDIHQSAEEIAKIKKLPMVDAEGIFMHFATADEADKTKAVRQYDNFKQLLKELEEKNIHFQFHHCSNSAAIMDMPQVSMEFVRQGISLYGLYPSDEVNKKSIMLFPALSLKSHVVHIKEVKAGWGISYGLTFVAEKPMKVATVSIGYGDGYPRQLSNKGEVLIHGKRAAILGRICMDQMMVDITDISDVQIEDVVTLIGKDGSECITAEELGEKSGRFNYELICDINKRVTRIYKK